MSWKTRWLAAGWWIPWLASIAAPPARGLAQEASEEEAAPSKPWSLRLSAELGAGSREVDIPMDGVVYRIRSGWFPVGGVGFELDHAASDRVRLGLHVRYQSSIAHGILEQHTDGSAHPLDLRAHRLELALAPTLRLDGSGTWVLTAAAGYGIHNLRPEVHHLLTPAYSLAGPHLRAGLQLAPGSSVIRLMVAPEIQWIAQVGADLRARGIAASGLGAGGEAAVELRLSSHFSVRAAYREMRFFLDSSQSRRFEDVARFVAARVSGAL